MHFGKMKKTYLNLLLVCGTSLPFLSQSICKSTSEDTVDAVINGDDKNRSNAPDLDTILNEGTDAQESLQTTSTKISDKIFDVFIDASKKYFCGLYYGNEDKPEELLCFDANTLNMMPAFPLSNKGENPFEHIVGFMGKQKTGIILDTERPCKQSPFCGDRLLIVNIAEKSLWHITDDWSMNEYELKNEYVAWMSQQPGINHVYLYNFDKDETKIVDEGNGLEDLIWSPDARFVSYINGGDNNDHTLKVYDIKEDTIFSTPTNKGVCERFFKDNKLYYVGYTGYYYTGWYTGLENDIQPYLSIIDLESGNEAKKPLTLPNSIELHACKVSPDGSMLAIAYKEDYNKMIEKYSSKTKYGIFNINGSKKYDTEATMSSHSGELSFSPDGKLGAFCWDTDGPDYCTVVDLQNKEELAKGVLPIWDETSQSFAIWDVPGTSCMPKAYYNPYCCNQSGKMRVFTKENGGFKIKATEESAAPVAFLSKEKVVYLKLMQDPEVDGPCYDRGALFLLDMQSNEKMDLQAYQPRDQGWIYEISGQEASPNKKLGSSFFYYDLGDFWARGTSGRKERMLYFNPLDKNIIKLGCNVSSNYMNHYTLLDSQCIICSPRINETEYGSYELDGTQKICVK